MCAKFIGIRHLILKLWSKNQFQMKNFGFRSDNPGKKELGHLIHFIAIIPVLAIVRTFGAMHCFKEASYLPICHILPHPHQSMLGDLARPLATWLGSTLHWGKGDTFWTKSNKLSQPFFPGLSERNPNFVIWNWFFDHNFEIKCPISIKFRTHNHENTNNVSSNQHK